MTATAYDSARLNVALLLSSLPLCNFHFAPNTGLDFSSFLSYLSSLCLCVCFSCAFECVCVCVVSPAFSRTSLRCVCVTVNVCGREGGRDQPPVLAVQQHQEEAGTEPRGRCISRAAVDSAREVRSARVLVMMLITNGGIFLHHFFPTERQAARVGRADGLLV